MRSVDTTHFNLKIKKKKNHTNKNQKKSTNILKGVNLNSYLSRTKTQAK